MQINLRKALAVVLALAMLCTLLPMGAIAVAAANVEMLENGNFESGNDNGWTMENGSSVTSSDKHGGSYAIKTSATSTKYQGMFYQLFDVMPNTDYTLTYWYKYDGTGSGPAIYVIVKDAGRDVTLNDGNSRRDGLTTGSWVKDTLTFNTGSYEQVTINFSNRVAGLGGTFYFDDISVYGPEVVAPDEPVTPGPEVDNNLMQNGGFETGNGNGWRLESGTTVINSNVHSGAYALKTTNTATKLQTMARQTFDVVANTDYVFTFWYKYEGSHSTPSFYAIVKDGNETININDSNSRISPSGSAWTKVSHTVNSGNYTTLTLVLQNRQAGDGGTYYFDDFSFVGPKPTELPDEPVNPVPEVDGNLVQNGNFETGNTSGWEKHQSTAVSADAAYTGYYGVKLGGAGDWGGMLNQTVPVEAGQTYQVSMWLKTISQGTNIKILDGGENGTKLGSDWFTNTEWTYKTWTVSPTTNSLFINFSGGNTGSAETVYLDDIVVIKAPLITNGDFETGDKTGWSCNSGTATIVTDAHSGNYALQLTNPDSWGEAAIRTIGVKPNTQYEVSWWSKRVSGTGTFNLVVSQTMSPWTNFERLSGENWMDKSADKGWVKNTCVYNTGDNTQMLLKFTSANANSGSILIDDVAVVELKNPSFDGYIYNGDFETGKTSGWNLLQQSEINQSSACNGQYGLHVKGNGSWNSMAEQTFTTVPGQGYTLFAYLKTVNNGANVHVRDKATDAKLASTWFTKSSWSLVQLSFVATSETSFVAFCGGGNGVAESVYVDDLFIVPTQPMTNDGYIFNGNFESGSLIGWTTHQQTVLSNKAAYEGSAGILMKGTGWGTTASQTFVVDMGNTYKLSFWYKPISGGINMHVLDAADESEIVKQKLSTSDGANWMLYEKTFHAEYSKKIILKFFGSGGSSADEMYVDNISIVNVGGEENVRNQLTENTGVSVRDAADDVRGLAFRFDLNASGVQVVNGNVFVPNSGKLNLYKNRVVEGTLVRAGAVVTNDATIGESFADFMLDKVDDGKTIDINAHYLLSLDEGSMGYAVRIINIPDAHTSTEIYARPYYVYNVDGQEVVVYGVMAHANYDGITNAHKSVNILTIGNENTDADEMLAPILESADYDNVVLGTLYNDGALDFDAGYTYEYYQYGDWTTTNNVSAAEILAGDWDYIIIDTAEGTALLDLQAFIYAVDAETDAALFYNNDQDMTQLSLTATVIPTYTAQQNLWGTGAEESDYSTDFVTAMAQYAVITGDSLDKVTYYPAEVESVYYDMARSVAHAMYAPYAVSDLSEVIIISGSDFQPSGGNIAAGRETVRNILGAMANDGYGLFDGFISGGDYSAGTSEPETSAGLAGLDAEISQVVYNNKFYAQGNHDPDTTIGLTPYGANDPFGAPYGLYVINEDNYTDLGDGGEATAEDLKVYLDQKVASGWNKPIFVVSHVPLNFSMRTISGKNARTAMPIVDVLNEAGANGLNIIFLFGHNHSSGYDNYIGGGSVYLKKGDTMLVPNYDNYLLADEVSLNFTYMTAGYIGYYGTTVNGADGALTMTMFRIQKDGSVIIGRYDANGIHNLKSAGAKNTDKGDTMEPDPTVYESWRVVTAADDRKYEG